MVRTIAANVQAKRPRLATSSWNFGLARIRSYIALLMALFSLSIFAVNPAIAIISYIGLTKIDLD
jgi:hypothetical protein